MTTTQGTEELEAANNNEHYAANNNEHYDEAESAEETNVDIEVDAKDLEKVNKEKLEKATKVAGEIDAAMKKAGDNMTTKDVNFLAEKLAEFVVNIRESMIFWPVATMWKMTPNFLKKAGAGKGIIGWTLNKTPGAPQMLTDMTKGMLEVGLLDSPDGVNPADFAKNATLMVKVLKWAIPIVGIFQPEVLAIQPFMPALEKLVTAKGELFDQVRELVKEKTEPVEAEQELARHETAGVATPAEIEIKKAA
ncbi:hypothetical protein A2344_03745 [Candidatus Peregrinibacteria bacterium RIFOXYB12_FULL_41_12]|nr:MAG: hypothetical protein A2344_03745 [Candidatus Peregrinibacteria bacterium RIFOXYB12_FULL_41_12]